MNLTEANISMQTLFEQLEKRRLNPKYYQGIAFHDNSAIAITLAEYFTPKYLYVAKHMNNFSKLQRGFSTVNTMLVVLIGLGAIHQVLPAIIVGIVLLGSEYIYRMGLLVTRNSKTPLSYHEFNLLLQHYDEYQQLSDEAMVSTLANELLEANKQQRSFQKTEIIRNNMARHTKSMVSRYDKI
ncbi:hypothetical protein EQG49_11975 [Periweissella cryptocerci]|uniref:Uncharacterized protein n=1 Tax=Periweissella cryptocerci TaxID=2506420 RepID=A0A4P6YWF9_9LACO|nr:hypothetical protein [Periweissella cryptocerci]QBO37121.1 hypothetical protein EQG49_11975 [Periweissella cryptocerci]